MKIKEPRSDIVLQDLSKLIRDLETKVNNCKNSRHNSYSILYISSYILSSAPSLSGSSISILDYIGSIVSSDLPNVLCVVRTVPPRHFPRNMARIQRDAVSRLQSNFCHVVLFPRNFGLNHAKFVLVYHFCFNEGKVYHGRFYGSTNLTSKGLCDWSRGPGNYEEYYYLRFDHVRRIGYVPYLDYYLEDIKNLMFHKINSYTDDKYLLEFCLEQLGLLERAYRELSIRVGGTSIVDYYITYIEASEYLWMVVSLLEDVPGSFFVQEKLMSIEEELERVESMFELDVLLPNVGEGNILEKRVQELLEILGWDEEFLVSNIKLRVELLYKFLEMLRDYCNYVSRNKIEGLKEYMSESELHYQEYAFEYGKNQIRILNKVGSENLF